MVNFELKPQRGCGDAEHRPVRVHGAHCLFRRRRIGSTRLRRPAERPVRRGTSTRLWQGFEAGSPLRAALDATDIVVTRAT
jgi:hypothetical protein